MENPKTINRVGQTLKQMKKMGKVSETMTKWGLGTAMAGLATVFAGSAVGCFEGGDDDKSKEENKSESKDNKDED